jgi:biofilm PGA synthesis N-glycosyltransferase PgaC
MQEWDYFHGIAAVKRLQSLYHGTLVAQGAFSIYKTNAIIAAGGWPKCVGEDIVLTWAMLKQGHRIGYAENACLFTNVPTTFKQLFNQRIRWSRGMIEAFKQHWQLLFKKRLSTMFIWWNLMFPWIDTAFTFFLIPGILIAFFGVYWLAGPLTLFVIPLSILLNYVMFVIQSRMFTSQGLTVRKNIFGFFAFAILYTFIMQPFCVYGYLKEAISGKVKNWGTK